MSTIPATMKAAVFHGPRDVRIERVDDPAAAGEAAAAAIDPPTDAIASAWYRRRMTQLFVRRALEEASRAV
jgi:CO/xanthine dehydrogenase FAD-binding subunit